MGYKNKTTGRPCGYRGCCAKTRRRGRERYCAQLPIIVDSDGGAWCYYHNPLAPKKFGECYTGLEYPVTHRQE